MGAAFMGIQSACATFTRFTVQDPVRKDFWGAVEEGLKAGSLKDITAGHSQSAGFSSWDDLFDTSFDFASYHKAEYVAFQFRLDQRKVPPILLKQYTRLAFQEYRDQHEGKWPGRKEKQRIREDVLLQLMDRTLPKPSACEIVWNTQRQWMLMGATSKRMLDASCEHLESHLQLRPVPLFHVQWATRLLSPRGRERAVLTSLVSPESHDAFFEGRFLGYEFLTWLWFHSETAEGKIRLEDGREAEVHLGDRMSLSLPDDGNERVICTTQASDLHEARTALQHGKLVEEAQLFIKMGENEYFLRLDTNLWAVRGLRTPKQMKEQAEEDLDGQFLEKMYFLEEVFACLDALYGHFLFLRLTPDWDTKTRPLLKKWSTSSTSS
jgi:DNA recombination-dependent growth factor C